MQTEDIIRITKAVPKFRELLTEAIDWHRERLRILTEMEAACVQWEQAGRVDDPLKAAMTAADGGEKGTKANGE